MFYFLLAAVTIIGIFSFTHISTSGKFLLPDPDPDNAGLKLPEGFGALKVAENTGQARHLVVTPNGAIYLKLRGDLKGGNGILYLQDNDQDGKMEKKTGFGNYVGTGLALKNG